MAEDTKPDQVLVDITISASLDDVWNAIRDPAAIANWFGWESASLKDEIDYIFVSHATADDQARTLRFAEWENIFHRLELLPHGTGTRLRLVISGAPDLDWTGIYEDVREGWVTFFHQLRFGLDRHPGQGRRTLYLSGLARSDSGDPRRLLGIGDLPNSEPGRGYQASSPVGEIAGHIWHKTHFQTGVTVDQWGDALLVVTHKGSASGDAPVAGSILLTTYGLSGETFASLQKDWKNWWQANYSLASAAG